jgi:hypothetical protein
MMEVFICKEVTDSRAPGTITGTLNKRMDENDAERKFAMFIRLLWLWVQVSDTESHM